MSVLGRTDFIGTMRKPYRWGQIGLLWVSFELRMEC